MRVFKMRHLLVNPHKDSIYPITWVAENCEYCKLDITYKDKHEPVLPIAIWVKLPKSDGWHAYGANDEGWLSTCDSYNNLLVDELEDMPVATGILAVEARVNMWVNGYNKNKAL